MSTFSTFSQFITQNAKTFKITSNQQNLNLKTWANASEGSGFWDTAIPKIFIIQPSVTIYSLDRTIPALTIPYISTSLGAGPNNKIIIINYGDIIAGGGLSASTSTINGGPTITVKNFNDGSSVRPAPFVDIYNYGNIYGGAGAGGKGGTGGQGRTSQYNESYWANTTCSGNSMPCYQLNPPHPCNCQDECNSIRSCGDGINYTLWEKKCKYCYTTYTYYNGGTGGNGGNGAQYNQSAGTGGTGANGGTNAGKGGDGGDGGALGQSGDNGDAGSNGNYTNGSSGDSGGSVGSWLEQGTDVSGSGTQTNVEQSVKWSNYGSGAVYGSITHPNAISF